MQTAWIPLLLAALATLGIITRPFRLPEYVFALAGAALLVLSGLLPAPLALAAIARGTDVYAFLAGMMLLSELARAEGVFEHLAARAIRASGGSSQRLFLIVYVVGTLVTTFLSNDATAVVLTPAVFAAARQARVDPMPHLFACAFVANAASFVLPISNPANLVIYGSAMPPLATWLAHLLLPALLAIGATFLVLRWSMAPALAAGHPGPVTVPPLSLSGRLVALGLALTALVLIAASLRGADLGLPTLAAGLAVLLGVTALTRRSPLAPLRHMSWGVLPLVAGLFVLVAGVFNSGLLDTAVTALSQGATRAPDLTAGIIGLGIALGSNLINNLPAGLIAATAGHAAHLPPKLTEALLIGVDLGPNLSVTGSLATLLWLTALRREGMAVSGRDFFRLGLRVMPPALLLSLAALILLPR